MEKKGADVEEENFQVFVSEISFDFSFFWLCVVKIVCRADRVAQVTEHLPSKPEALNSNLSTEKQQQQQNKCKGSTNIVGLLYSYLLNVSYLQPKTRWKFATLIHSPQGQWQYFFMPAFSSFFLFVFCYNKCQSMALYMKASMLVLQ
jgi:hypothetical protein